MADDETTQFHPDPASPNVPVQPADDEADGAIELLHGAGLRQHIERCGVRDVIETKLIESLVRNGNINVPEIQSFVLEARNANRTLLEQARIAGYAGEADLLKILGAIYDLETVSFQDDFPVAQDLALMINGDQAREWLALPYGRGDNNELLVAITDPSNKRMLEQLKRALPPNERIQPVLAVEADLIAYIDNIFGQQELVEAAVIDQADQVDIDVRTASNSKVVALFDTLLKQAVQQEASDIHIQPGNRTFRIRSRIDGLMRDWFDTVNPAHAQQLISVIKHLGGMKTEKTREPQDGRFSRPVAIPGVPTRVIDVRVAALPTDYGADAVTLRILDPERAKHTLDELGMSKNNLARFMEGIQRPHGLALITGPTGSGKTTTAHAALAVVNTPEVNVIAIEDPTEIKIPGIVPVPIPRLADEAKRWDFARALRSVLRSDPDVIFVGEIRDKETATTVVEAAETGHFVYSTLHTVDALGAIRRMQQLGVPSYMLGQVLSVVVAQRLVRRLCTQCRVEMAASKDLLRKYRISEWQLEKIESESIRVFAAKEGGCAHCAKQGYRGRMGVHEVLIVTDEMKEAITAEVPFSELTKMARANGMLTLRDDAFFKVAHGETSLEELRRVS